MRADRLVAILLMLQQRGQVTAAQVADELEVSERTARRDLDALGVAGVPVYAVQGRGGGWRLAGGGRTDLSGLTADEARALFLVTAPQATTPEVRAALRKLVRALPEPLRDRADAASRAVVVDPTGWDREASGSRSPPLLDAVQRAVIDAHQVRLGYRDRRANTTSRVVHPLGLAAKAGTWYLLADTDAGARTFRVDRITTVEPTGEPARRPDDFDLAAAWRSVVDRMDEVRTPLTVQARAHDQVLAPLRWVFGTRLSVLGSAEGGWVPVTVRAHDVRSVAVQLAGFGATVVVDDPPELCRALADIGHELVDCYP